MKLYEQGVYLVNGEKLVVDDAVWVPFFSSRHIFVKGKRIESFEPYWAGWGDVPLTGIKLKQG